ncbi:MAG: hypothetical protein HUK24_05075, partial [Sphaerochaetaceae bacterium]|nr:hypothetical protein [Sphaerochaetaceae bacterium]
CNEEETEKTIGQVWKDNGYLSDPHTAVALNVAQKYKEQSKTKNPVVVLSTASPYKFPGPVLKAIGITSKDSEFDQMEKLYEITKVPVPKNLSSLRGKEELHKDVINRSDILSYILNFLEN